MKATKKKSLLFTTFLGALLLTSCDLSAFGEEISTSIIDALIPNFWAFLAQLLALIVMIAVITIVAYKPLRKYMDDRSNKIQQDYLDAEKAKKETDANLSKSQEIISSSKKESMAIIDNAKKEAIEEKEKILEKAKKEVSKLKSKSQKDIEQMKSDAKEDIKKEIIEVAILASSKVLEREVSKEDNERLIDDLVNNIEK